jgi:phage terminase small subunit
VKNSPGRTAPRKAAPKGYSAEARRLWRDVLDGWTLDPPALTLLDSACRALMRVRQARDLLVTGAIVVKDRFGQDREHPAVSIENAAKQTLLRNLRALNLDLEPLHDRPGRPGGS